jgi:hypothetical protein
MLSDRARVCFFLLLLLFSLATVSQNVVVLEKFNHKRNYKYSVGSRIILELKDQKVVEGRITFIGDSTIVLDGLDHIKIDEIEYVIRKRHGFYQMWNLFFKKIALGYFAITTINRTIRDERPIFNTTNLIVVGSAALIGIIGKLLYVKKYQIDKIHWRVFTLTHFDLPITGKSNF